MSVPSSTFGGGIENAVVDPILAVLPELEAGRHDPVATPVLRPGHVGVGETTLLLDHGIFEGRSALDGLALVAGMGAELVASWPGSEVVIGLSCGHLLDGTLDPDLAAEWLDVPEQRGSWVLGKVLALATQVVRVDAEPPLVSASQQDHSSPGLTRSISGGQTDRLGFAHHSDGLFPPALELHEGIRVKGTLVKWDPTRGVEFSHQWASKSSSFIDGFAASESGATSPDER